MIWDLFCRVVDNLGDIGVCWRLAADLAGRGEAVRLWVDDAAALAFMAPGGVAGVAVAPWQAADVDAGAVVIEAFGCDPPPAFVARMARRARPPVWIDLEYLSAESYAERSHGLPSPQFAGPGAGLNKWFYFPGFTPATGGLIREPGLLQRQQRFDATAWLGSRGIAVDGARRVSLFCYDAAPVPRLLDALAGEATLLLVTPGAAARQVGRALGDALARGPLRAVLLPALTQVDFDHLLWSCDLNFVRGEDSFVRAQWAGQAFAWQAYPQSGAAHAAKLAAFEQRFLAGVAPALRTALHRLALHWNGLAQAEGPLELPPLGPWRAACNAWRAALLEQDDLTTQLQRFVVAKMTVK